MKHYKYLFIVTLLFLSCKNEEEVKILNVLKAIDLSKNLDRAGYMIIPNAGCSGCISSAERFMMKNIENRSIAFILTAFNSAKEIKLKLGHEVVNNDNVYLDHDNLVYQAGINSIYPICVFVDQGEIRKIEYVAPDNKQALTKFSTFCEESTAL